MRNGVSGRTSDIDDAVAALIARGVVRDEGNGTASRPVVAEASGRGAGWGRAFHHVPNRAWLGRGREEVWDKPCDPSRFLDLEMARLSAEPDREGAYGALVQKHPRGQHGRHRYSLEVFGLDADQVEEQPGFYRRRLPARWPAGVGDDARREISRGRAPPSRRSRRDQAH